MSEEIFSPKAMRIAIVSCTNGEKSHYNSLKTFHTRSTKSATDFHNNHLAAAFKFNGQTMSSNESNGVICRRQKDSCIPQMTASEITSVEPSEMEQLRSHLMKTDYRRSFKSNSFSSNGDSFSLVSRGDSFTGNVT